MTAVFTQAFKVRDYECDQQGIVNNAIYQNYLEHTRHEFLLSKGINFSELAAQGIDLVVRRAELDYLKPLRSGDHFSVQLEAEREKKVRFYFKQTILRSDGAPILNARFECTSLNAKGRPFYLAELAPLFDS